jgi:serine/threonine-protein kinase
MKTPEDTMLAAKTVRPEDETNAEDRPSERDASNPRGFHDGFDASGLHVRPPPAGELPTAGESLPPPVLEPGRLIGGRYEIGHRIGAGGHGAVYRGRHVALDLPVAIKVIAVDASMRDEVVARFVREARTVAQVRHRNVLDIHDAGQLEDGSPYLVTELIEGADLEQRIRMGPLSVATVVDLGRQIFSALAAIAQAGIVHRDIKPANVMLRREADGHVHATLIDFGIARNQSEVSRLTATGTILGTPHYMSPEQLRGEGLDARADLYAACTVLYEALTGVPPFDGETAPVVIGKILATELPPIATHRADCPEDLRELIERGLSRDPNDRPPHPLEVGVLLDRIAHHENLPSGPLAWREDAMFSAPGVILKREMDRVSGIDSTAMVPAMTAPFPLSPRKAGTVASPTGPSRRWMAFAAVMAVLLTGSAWMAVAGGDNASAPSAVVDPAEVDASLAAGLQALARGENDAALEHYRAAVELDAGRTEAHRGRGLAAAHAGFGDEAIRALERYLALAPDAADAGRIRDRLRQLRAHRASR